VVARRSRRRARRSDGRGLSLGRAGRGADPASRARGVLSRTRAPATGRPAARLPRTRGGAGARRGGRIGVSRRRRRLALHRADPGVGAPGREGPRSRRALALAVGVGRGADARPRAVPLPVCRRPRALPRVRRDDGASGHLRRRRAPGGPPSRPARRRGAARARGDLSRARASRRDRRRHARGHAARHRRGAALRRGDARAARHRLPQPAPRPLARAALGARPGPASRSTRPGPTSTARTSTATGPACG
jgi:hypothetical protein